MLIEEKRLQHWIDNFYGYGSWDARTWFIAYEEGGVELPEEVAGRLDYFYTANPPGTGGMLCDIRKLYEHIPARMEGPRAGKFRNLYEYRFDRNAVLNSPWKNLISFVHGYRNKKLPDLLAYQKNSFALASKNKEALVPLYPLPSPHNHAWYYSWLELPKQFDFLKSRASYEKYVYQGRIQKILHHLSIHRPEVVLMYGMNNINLLKKSVLEVFPKVQFKMVKGSKLQIPQHHRADFNGTTLLITTQVPTLKHNRVETGFDWEEFGKKVKSENQQQF